MREISDFIFDLDASQRTTDTLSKRTYTIPFVQKGDLYSTYNLVMVADSVDNVFEQYVLQYEFDSIQYHSFLQSQDFLNSGVTIKRFPFSTFFNDSSPNFLERCQDIFDSNGDPISCDQVQISYASGGGGGSSGGSNSVTISQGSGGGSGPIMCSWTISYTPCTCEGAHTFYCNCPPQSMVLTITCNDAYMRKSTSQDQSMMTCMDCNLADFGSPAFTLTRDATTIDNLIGGGGILTDYHLAYLSTSTAFSAALRNAILNDPNFDQDAALFTITAGMNGALTGNFNTNFALAIEGMMTESEADLTQDPILRLFQTYFEVRYAALKAMNTGWSNEKLFYETAKEAIHFALDGAGLIPGFGEPADLFNAGLYFLEGDRLNGTLSLTAAVPFVGWFSTTAKGAVKFVGYLPGTTKKMSHVWGKIGDQVIFGGTDLRKVIQLTDPTKHAHHIIPIEHINHTVVQKAAKAENPFHINEFNNGIAVDAWQNTTHPSYNTRLNTILNEWNSQNPYATPEAANAFLENKMEQIFQLIQNNPTVKINDLSFR